MAAMPIYGKTLHFSGTDEEFKDTWLIPSGSRVWQCDYKSSPCNDLDLF